MVVAVFAAIIDVIGVIAVIAVIAVIVIITVVLATVVLEMSLLICAVSFGLNKTQISLAIDEHSQIQQKKDWRLRPGWALIGAKTAGYWK